MPFTADNINLNSIRHLLASLMNRWDSILNSNESITATELSKYDNEFAEIKTLLIDINNLELYSDISVATAKINELQTLLNTIEESITSKFETVDNQILSKFRDTDSLIVQNIDLFNQDKITKFEELETDFNSNLSTLNQTFATEKNTLFNDVNLLIQDIQNKLDSGFFKGEKGDSIKGDKGDPLRFEDLTPDQIESLKVINPNDYFTKEDITSLLANKADVALLSQKADIDTLNQVLATLQSNDLNLDTLQEIVNFITVNRDTLNNLSLDNIACGTLYRKVSVELYSKLSSLRTNQEVDLLLADKANSTGSIEKTFKVANAQLPQEAINLQQIQDMLSSLTYAPVNHSHSWNDLTDKPNLSFFKSNFITSIANRSNDVVFYSPVSLSEFIHIKTNLLKNSGVMFLLSIRGYCYHSNLLLDFLLSGFLHTTDYLYNSVVLTKGAGILSSYYSSTGNLVIVINVSYKHILLDFGFSSGFSSFNDSFKVLAVSSSTSADSIY
ncbi:MAG: hypothetical protein RBT49_17535 [Bacteroidales bacterium]|jgi:hypothetical protein|nr:hypothetical protein [Bacteroidales bacterium]